MKGVWYHLMGATYSKYSQQRVFLAGNLTKEMLLSSFTKSVSNAKYPNIITSNISYPLYLIFHWILWIAATHLVHIGELNNWEKLLFRLFLLFILNVQNDYSSDRCVSKCIYLLKFSLFFCWGKVDFAPSLMARIVLERYLQEKEQAIRKYLSFFFSFVFLTFKIFLFQVFV